MFDKHDIRRNACQLFGKQSKKGYDWWWHSFTGVNETTGKRKAFFFEFFLCNPFYGKEEPVYGQLKENQEKGVLPSYLMVKAGAWGEDARQLHRFFGWKSINVNYGVPFSVIADDCELDETRSKGHILVKDSVSHPEWMCQDGEMSWDLKIHKVISYNVGYGASGPFRKMQLFEMFWHAEGMKCQFEGSVTYNGERYRVEKETCNGYADKNWGKDFTSPWVWLSSNSIVSKNTGKKLLNTVFDIGGGCPKIGPFALKRKLLSAIYYEGKCYEFNFSKFWTFTRTKFSSTEKEAEILWEVEQKTWRNRYVARFSCKKDEMLLVRYESPDGKMRHTRLWNGGTGKGSIELYRGKRLIDTLLVEEAGCEYGEYPAKTH